MFSMVLLFLILSQLLTLLASFYLGKCHSISRIFEYSNI